jgi:inner membrane protein
MPTILTHPAVPIAIAIGLGDNVISKRLLFAGIVFSIVPDFDVIAFHFGIPYASAFGHRGLSHSILFALVIALASASFYHCLNSTFIKAFSFIFLSAVSHGVLDAFTTGGLGVAFLWPWSAERYFAPLQMIRVSPIGIANFMSPRGVIVLWSEVRWVWLPCLSLAMIAVMIRQKKKRPD